MFQSGRKPGSRFPQRIPRRCSGQRRYSSMSHSESVTRCTSSLGSQAKWAWSSSSNQSTQICEAVQRDANPYTSPTTGHHSLDLRPVTVLPRMRYFHHTLHRRSAIQPRYDARMPRTAIDAAIGAVSQNCAQLEGLVAIVAWGLAGLPQNIARIVVPNNMDTMLGLIKALLPIRVEDADLRSRVVAWCGEVKTAYTERSLLIHSLWIPDEPEGTYFRAHIKPNKAERETRTLREINNLSETLLELATIRPSAFIGELVRAAPGHWSVVS